MELADALVTIRRYLRQNGLDRFGKLVNTLNATIQLEEKIDWKDVFFVTNHLGSGGSTLSRAVNNLTLKPQDQCSVQVVVATDAGHARQGINLCVEKKPILILAFAETFEETKNMKDEVAGLNLVNKNAYGSIRFDFVDPDLHRLKLIQEVDLTQALLDRVKEGVLALQMDVENYAVTVGIADFRQALTVAVKELDLSKLPS